jgi:hypothetical protein
LKGYVSRRLYVFAILSCVAICGIMNEDIARADWLHPDYSNPDGGGSTASSDSASDDSEASDLIVSNVTNGFEPKIDGFSFENYGRDVQYGSDGLTIAEMQRMFGEKVCAGKEGGECILTPPAERWMDQNNGPSGHCQGMAVLSALLYYGEENSSDFGADDAYELSIEDNKPLQHEIAYWAAMPASSDKDVDQSPSAVLDNLTNTLKKGLNASEWWTLGVYRPDESGGHAVTPFGVEDLGDGQFKILVYDNNWPGETRYVEVDRDDNTWQYDAAIDPDEPIETYSGNASLHNLILAATSPLLERQRCDFCDEGDNESLTDESASKAEVKQGLRQKNAEITRYLQIWLDGNASLLITDVLGRRIGRVEAKKFVNEIPGAKIEHPMDVGAKAPEKYRQPIYYIPASLNFTIKVDGAWLNGQGQDEEYVTMIGPGYDLVVEGLLLDPGEHDYIDVATVGKEDYRLTYRTNYTDSPDLIIGKDTEPASYEFMARGDKVEPEGNFSVELDMNRGMFIINPRGNSEADQFELLMHRIDDYGEQFFGAKNISLNSTDMVFLNFLDWEEDGQKMYLTIDHGNTGIPSERVEMENNTEFREYWE